MTVNHPTTLSDDTESTELSSPNARAERLRTLRSMANLTREEMCNTDDLNINTYRGWERARYGGLPNNAAERVIHRLAKENIVASTEWLIDGTGHKPFVLPWDKGTDEATPEDKILSEISAYRCLHPNSTYAQVTDDGLSPAFNPGDYVAGIKYTGDSMRMLFDKICIVQKKSGETLVRFLREDKNTGRFMLCTTNPTTTVDQPTEYDVKLNFAAPIGRVYKIS